jgi:hypothetical protein
MIDDNAVKNLMKALETGMYSRPHQHKLEDLLSKLGIKSAMSSSSLKIESLEAILNQVTFNDTSVKLWKQPSKT